MNVVQEKERNSLKATYHRAGNQIIYSEVNGSKNFYVYNAQGNVSRLVDATGETVSDYTFDAFGVQRTVNGDVYNPFRHNGEYYDEELGYTYLRNRYYDNNTGRFISEDPVRDGGNWYSYCAGNPIDLIDPLGLVKVGLREYAATYSGSTVGWDAESGTATVDWNGKRLSVKSTDENNIDGSIYIDDSQFIYAFGLGDEDLIVYEDTVTGNASVRVNFNIDDKTDNTVEGMTINGIYTELFRLGIEKYWSNETTSVHAGQNNNGIKVYIRDVTQQGEYSNSYCGKGDIYMYTGDSRTGIGHKYSGGEFMATSAHEFGHSGFNLGDTYPQGSKPSLDPGILNPFTSIMNSQFSIDRAQPVDFAIVFRNRTWESSKKFYYSNDATTLDEFIGTGKW
jgi:RHS repeat-associated protein